MEGGEGKENNCYLRELSTVKSKTEAVSRALKIQACTEPEP